MKKLVSILLTLAVALSLLVVPAVVSAGTTDYTEAVLSAADNLAANQNTDGGFDWGQPDGDPDLPAAGSPTNTLGITAMGILEGYKLEDKVAYETALGNAYNYVVDNLPAYESGVETTKGADSFPDVTFLIGLANTPVLATPSDAADLAKARWDTKVTALGSATLMAESIRDTRHGQNYDSLIPWDLEAAVKAALALDAYFPGDSNDYPQQAKDIAAVIRNSVDDTAGTYFSSTDETQEGYVCGLTGAIEAFVEVGEYSAKTTELKALLLDVQQDDGYWNWYGASPADKAVQDTAYAVMALLRQGDNDAIAAAQKGADWLVLSQYSGGGWYAEGDIAPENLEVDSEAAWAIKVMLDEFGTTVSMTADVPDIVAISVDPTVIDFGTLLPGDTSDEKQVTVENIGTHTVNVSANVDAASSTDLFYSNLQMVLSSTWTTGPNWTNVITGLAMGKSQVTRIQLPVPDDYTPLGVESGTLVFEATAAA